nr:hypothetical protein [Candidatus Freyarchaeota archaeon]
MKCTNPSCQKEIFALLYSELGGVRDFTVYVERGKLKYELDRNEPDEKTGFKCPYCGTVLAETEEAARTLLQPVDREVCSICGRSVKRGSGLFVDRVQDFNSSEKNRDWQIVSAG